MLLHKLRTNLNFAKQTIQQTSAEEERIRTKTVEHIEQTQIADRSISVKAGYVIILQHDTCYIATQSKI